ncbi:MAG: class I SAM-dependent methyltransferase [Alphaproteobacteria bacterium]|nr:class I SAM-dependent methyltransferase [Alphaproteobacteria bacterium]
MSLADARWIHGATAPLPPGPPYPCVELDAWSGASFRMPPGDPRLADLHEGGPAPSPPLDNLAGLVAAWQTHPEWLDFLDPAAPNHADKLLERALYLRWWGEHLPATGRVLDLGGGCGRFAAWLLGQGLDVEVVDADLRSLWRALQHAVGRPGRVDLHWTTAERLPPLAPVDAVVAAEVLCYVEDPAAALAQVRRVLKPGGVLLCSVEARWGWAAALDAASGTLDALLGDGVVHVPGDRWVRTFTEPDLRALLADFEILACVPTHYIPSGPFELAGGGLDLDGVLAWEARLRERPETAHLNRAWTAVARRAV